MEFAYESLYRKTRLLVDTYVETRRQGQVLSTEDLASDPSVQRAMQTLQQEIASLPPSEQAALYARMVLDAIGVAREESESVVSDRDKLALALRLIEGYCRNLLESLHRALRRPSGDEEPT